MDRLYRTSEVAALEGMSTRWLAEKVRTKQFPAPDVKAETRGAPDRWYESTLRRFREERSARVQAERGPAAAA